MNLLALLGSLLLVLSGCSHVLSEAALENIDPAVEFAEVKADPRAHLGKTLLIGGMIIDNRTSREGSTLEILRYSLDRYGNPVAPDEAGGRFLVRGDRFLDPELYSAGLMVTLTGTVAGEETLPLEGIDYTYPVFRLGEIHLWRRAYPEPFYRGYYYSDPFYDPFYPYYQPYPFWRPYRPYWYPSLRHRYLY